jgi:hypothetical protein
MIKQLIVLEHQMNSIIVEAHILRTKYLIAFAVQKMTDAYNHLTYVTKKLNVHSVMMKNSAKPSIHM